MKINWAMIRDVTLTAYEQFKGNGGFSDIRGFIYEKYRESSNRKPLTDEEKKTIHNTSWREYIDEAARAQQETEVSLQIRDASGQMQYDRNCRRKPQTGDVLEAIIHSKTAHVPASRLQFIVTPLAGGAYLHVHLKDIMKNSNIVTQWKVMNPELGATGPDSAVLYLNCGIEDPQVGLLIGLVKSSKIGKYLDKNCQTPLGLIRLADGVFGCDLPRPDLQHGYLESSTLNSAGWVMASVIAKGLLAARNATQRKSNYIEVHVVHHVAEALEKIGWTLLGALPNPQKFDEFKATAATFEPVAAAASAAVAAKP
jgi:hypothetical protein